MDGDNRPPSWICAYPDLLKQIEDKLLRLRRKPKDSDTDAGAQDSADVPDQVGFGVSGGGIRSATFALGVFQALARQKLLSKIDYLSTVSGGGYFGSFYGRLFTRTPQVASVADVEEILATCAASEEQDPTPDSNKFPKGQVFRWLRENGRYLAPRGSGGILLDSAVMMRNWAALQAVLATFMIMVFLGLQLVRGLAEVSWQGTWWWKSYEEMLVSPPLGTYIWWTPYAILPILAFVIFVVPPAWSYWLFDKPNRRDVPGGRWIPPRAGLVAALVLEIVGGYKYWNKTTIRNLCIGLLVPSVLTALQGMWSYLRSYFGTDGNILNSEDIRDRLSVKLKNGLVLTGGLLAFVVLDSLAQTAYAVHLVGKSNLGEWAAWFFGLLTVAVGFGRSIFVALGSNADGKRISLPLSVVAGFAAVVVAGALLVTFDFAAYAIAWQGSLPIEKPPGWVLTTPAPGDLLKIVRQPSGNYLIKHAPAATGKPETVLNLVRQGPGSQAIETWAVQNPPAPEEDKKDETKKNDEPKVSPDSRNDYRGLLRLGAALAIAFGFSFLFGWSWPFLNHSTLHPLYTSRLIRAYLGASNPDRLGPESDVTEVVPGDDLNQDKYWSVHALAPPPSPFKNLLAQLPRFLFRKKALNFAILDPLIAKGGPLHLVNVTINETIDGRSAVEQTDRKGVGMAIGPAAISAGVSNHVVFGASNEKMVEVFPTGANTFRMFGDTNSFQAERLSLGDWMGISGAAFSTGLGSRTSLALSFLAGWANIRLGYWWNSGVNPESRKAAAPSSRLGKFKRLIAWLFTVQTYLLDELTARFRGPARQWWYLTDGGHFENMGGYELIRRRPRLIVILDAEADPDYSFEGMANLVRKARLDFGAEIEFLGEESLDTVVDAPLRGYFGTPEQLRRGRWVEEPIEMPGAPPRLPGKQRPKRRVINPPDEAALSTAYASLAVVSYPDQPSWNSLILYVKPALIGAEPVDVRRYHTEHPSFPQETTAEQFFNEAQWESYRKLGEHIAGTLFAGAAVPDEKFTPRKALNGSIPWDVLRTFVQG